jgi:hypothetical protein
LTEVGLLLAATTELPKLHTLSLFGHGRSPDDVVFEDEPLAEFADADAPPLATLKLRGAFNLTAHEVELLTGRLMVACGECNQKEVEQLAARVRREWGGPTIEVEAYRTEPFHTDSKPAFVEVWANPSSS